MSKILVIDASEDIRDMMSLVLQTFGYETMVLSTNTEASEIISFFNPHLIILDPWPNKSGKEMYKQIKTTFNALPLILMSGNEKLFNDYQTYEADDMILKPFDLIELKGKIEKLLT